ncbi:hypothetical protein QAD02_005980 [Eretmocerus hayati]|uniref:Uncharacterized protein n=1 Tax=Eretmocerus hayati TaxID=131215 RepID=A0ACC2N050_9HYME|nr:hypothetical protein QAD02_005980 [Eretmocerus hayati]
MDHHYFETEHKVQIKVQDAVRKYRQLQSASSQGQIESVDLLLDAGALVNGHPICRFLQSPLHLSVYSGNLKIIERLLSAGASVNVMYSGDTPLTLAAKLGKFKIVDLLLESNGIKNCANDDQINHLHIACMRNRVDIARELLHCESDINAAVSCKSHYWPGLTPFHFAVQFQCLETVEFLLNIGADITIKDPKEFTPLQLAYLLGYNQIVDSILLVHDRNVSNPFEYEKLSHFHIACIRNQPKIVEHFIDLGVDLQDPIPGSSVCSVTGTVISLAIQHQCTDVVKLLLQHRTCDEFSRYEKLGMIKDAYCTGNMEIVELLKKSSQLGEKIRKFHLNYLGLLNDRCDREIKKWKSVTPNELNVPITSSGCTILHAAIQCKNEHVSKFLVNQGADYTIQDIKGKSPLHLAFEHNMNDLVDLMLISGKRFFKNIVDNNGFSHFHIACASNNAKAVQSFLKLGVNVNSCVNSNSIFWPGYTALHFTTEFNCEKVAQLLLKHGANYSATNASSLSAFDIAFMKAHTFVSSFVSYNRSLSNTVAFDCMKLILTFHLKRKDKWFNDRGVSLLHLACMKFESCSYPLDEEGIPRQRVESYFTPLEELIKLLKSHSGEVNKAIHKMNTSWDGFTPLHFAVGHYDLREHAMALIQNGADVLAQNANEDTPMHFQSDLMVSHEFILDLQHSRLLTSNHVGTEGFSIFHRLCTQGNVDLIKFMLERGVDPNHPTLNRGLGYEDDTSLHLIIRRSSDSSLGVAKLLLDHGADPNVRDFEKSTPLHLMYNCKNRIEIMDTLLSYGADINIHNPQLDTPLISLFKNLSINVWTGGLGKYSALIVSFLGNGADISCSNVTGETAFSIAYGWASHSLNRIQESLDVFHVLELLSKHIIKLENIGIYVSDRDEDLHSLLFSKYSNLLKFDRDTYARECVNELKLLKKTRIDSHASLRDILFQSPKEIAIKSQNSTVQNLVDSDEFCKKYPIYGALVKSRIKQGQVRWRLLNESVKALKVLSGITLPRVCSGIILQYLTIEDLRNITESNKNRLRI